MTQGPAIDDLIAILARGEDAWPELKGLAEGERLEFKAEPYALDQPYGKIELAKDVSSFANASGGLIVIGVRTRPDPETPRDLAEAPRPVPIERLNADSLDGVIREYVHPWPENLTVRVWRTGDNEKALATIHVPQQDSQRKYFLVSRGLRDDHEVMSNHLALFVRSGSHCSSLAVETVYEMIRVGRRTLDGTPVAGEVIPPTNRARARSAQQAQKSGTVTEQDASTQADALGRAAGLSEGATLLVQAWPREAFDLLEIQSRAPGGLRERFERTPSLRPMGFNLDFALDAQTLAGGGLRKVSQEEAALSLLPSGLTSLVVGARYLSWGMAPRGEIATAINPTALIEFVVELLRFYSENVVPALGMGAALGTYRLSLKRLRDSGITKLPEGIPRRILPTPVGELPAEADGVDTILNLSTTNYTRIAYHLLARVYREFGLGPDSIPYSSNETIDVEALRTRK